MQQIKIFRSIETETENLENDINRWLRETGARVISMTGNLASQPSAGGPSLHFSSSDVLIVILYEARDV